MRAFIIVLTCLCLAGLLHAQTADSLDPATAAEVQSFSDAYQQSVQLGITQLNLAYAQVAAGLCALFLVLNLRTLCFAALIGYAIAILNVPYYIPTQFKYFFGISIIVLSVVGLLLRLLLWGKKKGPSAAK